MCGRFYIWFLVLVIPPWMIESWFVITDSLAVSWFYSSGYTYAITSLVITLLIVFSVVSVSCFLVGIYRIIFLYASSLFLFINSISTLVPALFYEAPLRLGGVASIIESNASESIEFVENLPYSISIFLLLYVIITVYAFIRLDLSNLSKVRERSAYLMAFTGAVLCFIVVYLSPILVPNDGAASNVIWRIINISDASPILRLPVGYKFYREEKEKLMQSLAHRGGEPFQVASLGRGPDVIVLIQGESLRRDHLSIYGYDKQTTPNLGKIIDSLYIARKAIAAAPLTYLSIPKIYSMATVLKPDLFYERPSIVSIAKKAGYKTYWVSNQGPLGGPDKPATYIAHESDVINFINTHGQTNKKDMDLVPLFKKYLSEKDPKKFIVLHIMGSHPTFNRRYDGTYSVFTSKDYPELDLPENRKKIVSEYDNTVIYTDYFISTIINILKESRKSSWVGFLSDHGLMLFDDGAVFGHKDGSKEQYEIPFFYWVNNWDISKIPGKSFTINLDKPFISENLFYTMLSVLDVVIPEYNERYDFLSNKYESPDLDNLYVSDSDGTPIKFPD